jgi:hypothetical protein
MQIYVPYPDPLEVAKCLDRKRLHSQIREAHLLYDSLIGIKKWKGVLVEMYRPYQAYILYYINVLEAYRDGDVEYIPNFVKIDPPPFLTEEFCRHHQKRLYSHAPDKYPQFSHLGKSEVNWYYDNINDRIVKYLNGIRVN